MNTKIIKWLESGKIREAILGEGDYFVQNHTYRSDHDLLLVLFTLLEWAMSTQNITAASTSFKKIVEESDEAGNLERMRNLLVSYDIASKEAKQYLQIDLNYWRQRFRNQLLSHLEYIRQNESWQGSIKNMSKRFPELKDVLEIIKREA